MKITRETTANKLSDYLHGKITQAELVDWAERTMMDADFEPPTPNCSPTLSAVSASLRSPSSGCAGRTAKSFSDDLAIARRSPFHRTKMFPTSSFLLPTLLPPFPGVFGVFYQNDRPTKNALEKKWVDSTREKLGQPSDLQLLQKTFDRMK